MAVKPNNANITLNISMRPATDDLGCTNHQLTKWIVNIINNCEVNKCGSARTVFP